jgi:beta-lactamase regulating signal transducer with metallopeptidase domain
LGILAGLSLLRTGRRIVRIRTTLRALVATARHDAVLGADVVESPYPFSFATAVSGGRVVVSSALCSGKSPETLAIVLRHERAHLTQRHPQLRLMAALLSVTHLPAVRRALMDDLALACEEVCDELSVGDDHDRPFVAETLLGVARRYRGRPLPSALPMMAFHGSHLQDRVESLLATYPAFPHRPAGSRWRWVSVRGALVLAFCGWSFWQVGLVSLRVLAE